MVTFVDSKRLQACFCFNYRRILYANVIIQLRVAIKEKRRGKLATGVLLLYDNAPVHKSRVAQVAVRAADSPTIAQTWPQVTIICFEIWSGTCVVWDFGTIMVSRLKVRFGDQTGDFYFKGIDCLKKVDQMHWSKWGLYWKIMLKPSSNPSSTNLFKSAHM